jgi:ribosomal protein S30
MLGLIKAKNGEKNCPVRKNRKREDNDDFRKEIVRLQTPRRSSKKRQSQPILNSTPLSREKEFLFSSTTSTTEFTPPVREDVVSSGMGKADTIGRK